MKTVPHLAVRFQYNGLPSPPSKIVSLDFETELANGLSERFKKGVAAWKQDVMRLS